MQKGTSCGFHLAHPSGKAQAAQADGSAVKRLHRAGCSLASDSRSPEIT